jgi:sRNA-binding protein
MSRLLTFPASAELVSVSLTLAIMWFMVEYGLRVHLARKVMKRAKRLLERTSKEPQKKDGNEITDANAKENAEHSKNEAKVSALQPKPEDGSRNGQARYRKWLPSRETSKSDEEKGTEKGK